METARNVWKWYKQVEMGGNVCKRSKQVKLRENWWKWLEMFAKGEVGCEWIGTGGNVYKLGKLCENVWKSLEMWEVGE